MSPVTFQPPMPAAAAEANEKAAAAAEDALADAEAKVIEAEDLLGSVRGRAGEVAAAAALQQAQADVAAAEKRLVDASAAGAAATEAAAATAPLLEQYDVVVWKPRKKMMVGAALCWVQFNFSFFSALFSFVCHAGFQLCVSCRRAAADPQPGHL